MTRNIFVLIVCLFGLSISTGLAQDDSDYKGMKFEAHPKHQSEIGISVGHFMVLGDVLPQPSWGVGLHFRRAFDYAFAWRIDAQYGVAKGLEPRNSGGSINAAAANYVLNGNLNNGLDYVNYRWYHNYKTTFMSFTAQGIWSLNVFNFKKQVRKANVYLVGGVGFNTYKAYYDASGRGGMHNFETVEDGLDVEGSRADRKTAKDRIKAILDGDYETRAEIASGRGADNDPESTRINFHANAGVGASFKINERINISIEQLVTFVFGREGDLLDGYRWRNSTDLTQNNDLVSYTNIRFNFNIGGKESRSEPLWWVSPLSLMAEDIAEVKARKEFDPTDGDNDGVLDVVDQELDTPEGFPVDTKGIQLDSDNDGVADGLDKEPYSPPGYNVDGEGIAVVPASNYTNTEDVNRIVDSKLADFSQSSDGASDWWLPMIHFDLDRYDIKASERGKLRSVADVMKNYPNKRIAVVGHTDRSADNCYNDVLSYNRAEAAINYIVSKYGISRDRFILNWSGEGDNLVDSGGANLWNRRVEFRVATNEAEEDRPDCRKNAGKKGTGYDGNKEAGY